MDGVTVHEENVPGLQVVGLSLNVVGCLSGKKDDHFVKIMIMVGKFPFGLVLDVKKPEILLQIAGFSVGSLKEFICYGSCFNYGVYGTANFACSYVCVASYFNSAP